MVRHAERCRLSFCTVCLYNSMLWEAGTICSRLNSRARPNTSTSHRTRARACLALISCTLYTQFFQELHTTLRARLCCGWGGRPALRVGDDTATSPYMIAPAVVSSDAFVEVRTLFGRHTFGLPARTPPHPFRTRGACARVRLIVTTLILSYARAHGTDEYTCPGTRGQLACTGLCWFRHFCVFLYLNQVTGG